MHGTYEGVARLGNLGLEKGEMNLMIFMSVFLSHRCLLDFIDE